MACGQPIPAHEIRIIDDAGRELGERREGRLEFRGPSATSGYFQNPVKTRELFDDGWLDTGDRGYVADGDLFITGRIKDIIIRAGQHIAPHEIEQAVGAVPGIRKDGVAAFGVRDPASGTERVVVLAETSEPHPADPAALKERAQAAATHIVGGPPDEVVLLQPGTVPKTASGKIRRGAARDLYLGKTLEPSRRALWWQVARLELRRTRHADRAALPPRRRIHLCRLVVGGDRHELRARLVRRDAAAARVVALGRAARHCPRGLQACRRAVLGDRSRDIFRRAARCWPSTIPATWMRWRWQRRFPARRLTW